MIALVAVGCLCLLVVAFVMLRRARRTFVRVEISGRSMSPTFSPGDRVLVRRTAPEHIAVGDIVVVESPEVTREQVERRIAHWRPAYAVVERDDPVLPDRAGAKVWAIKRVAAVAGDPLPALIDGGPQGDVVPADSLALLGDNLTESVDSRHHGCVPVSRVLGKVVRMRG